MPKKYYQIQLIFNYWHTAKSIFYGDRLKDILCIRTGTILFTDYFFEPKQYLQMDSNCSFSFISHSPRIYTSYALPQEEIATHLIFLTSDWSGVTLCSDPPTPVSSHGYPVPHFPDVRSSIPHTGSSFHQTYPHSSKGTTREGLMRQKLALLNYQLL